eukprot:CFRG4518T1
MTSRASNIEIDGPGAETDAAPGVGKLLIIRHGLSEYNKKHQFTGWHDPKLTDEGISDALDAGHLITQTPLSCGFTSNLLRAQLTLDLVLKSAGQSSIPVICDDALNERDYGDLNGMTREIAVTKYGLEMVQKWRRSYSGCPPDGESLKTCRKRTIPYLKEKILPEVMAGKNVIVCSHGNTIRAIVMYLMEYSTEQVLNMEIGWCEPLIISFNGYGEVVSLHCKPRPGHPSRSRFPERATMVRNNSLEGMRNDLPTYFPVQTPHQARTHRSNTVRRTKTVPYSPVLQLVDEIVMETSIGNRVLHLSSTNSKTQTLRKASTEGCKI